LLCIAGHAAAAAAVTAATSSRRTTGMCLTHPFATEHHVCLRDLDGLADFVSARREQHYKPCLPLVHETRVRELHQGRHTSCTAQVGSAGDGRRAADACGAWQCPGWTQAVGYLIT
jgi:hypothetical protein